VCEEGGEKRDCVRRFESVLAEQLRGQFHRGYISYLSVQTRDIRHANLWLIDNRLQAGPNSGSNRLAWSANGDEPFGAVAQAHDFVLVSNVFYDVLGVQAKIDGAGEEALVPISRITTSIVGELRNWNGLVILNKKQSDSPLPFYNFRSGKHNKLKPEPRGRERKFTWTWKTPLRQPEESLQE